MPPMCIPPYLMHCRAANLPASARHADAGAEVAGLVPLYGKTDVVGLSKPERANNRKRILWTAMETLLAPLYETDDEDGRLPMRGGFRCVSQCYVTLPTDVKVGESHPRRLDDDACDEWITDQVRVSGRCVGTFDLKFDSGRRCRADVYTCFFVMLAGTRRMSTRAPNPRLAFCILRFPSMQAGVVACADVLCSASCGSRCLMHAGRYGGGVGPAWHWQEVFNLLSEARTHG